jgi:hypothetical protein
LNGYTPFLGAVLGPVVVLRSDGRSPCLVKLGSGRHTR